MELSKASFPPEKISSVFDAIEGLRVADDNSNVDIRYINLSEFEKVTKQEDIIPSPAAESADFGTSPANDPDEPEIKETVGDEPRRRSRSRSRPSKPPSVAASRISL